MADYDTHMIVEASDDEGKTWVVLDRVSNEKGDTFAPLRWSGTGKLTPKWTSGSQPRWYRQTDTRTPEEHAAISAQRLEDRISQMAPEHQQIVRAYYALGNDHDAKTEFMKVRLHHDLLVRPYHVFVAAIENGWEKY